VCHDPIVAIPVDTNTVRIGFGLGTATDLDGPRFDTVVDELERHGFDSVWFSERIGASAPDPLVAMAYTLGRTKRLKVGNSVMVLPGRNPIVLAKALASLAVIAPKRVLPAFGLGAVDPNEHAAFGVERGERAAIFDEALAVMRACWDGGPVTFHGEHFHFDAVRVLPTPDRLDVWLGGIAPSELRRVGRLADGWLPSFVTPGDVAAGRAEIERVATEHERTIEPDHFGVLIAYTFGPMPERFAELIARRRPDLDVTELIPTSWEALQVSIGRFVEAGASKFVVLPIAEPPTVDGWIDHLREAADALLPLEG
jgi:probable F420-dependent oxidoreductase